MNWPQRVGDELQNVDAGDAAWSVDGCRWDRRALELFLHGVWNFLQRWLVILVLRRVLFDALR